MAQPTKKPNSFSKGMMSDIDANALPPDTYKEAVNARLITKQDNSFVLKNANGNEEYISLDLSQTKLTFTQSTILGNPDIDNLTSQFNSNINNVQGFKVTLSGNGNFVTEDFIVNYGDTVNGTQVLQADGDWTFLLSSIAQKISASSTAQAVVNCYASGVYTDNVLQSYSLNFADLTTETITVSVSVNFTATSSGIEQFNLDTSGYNSTITTNDYYVVGVATFSDYIAVIATQNTSGQSDAIFKVKYNYAGDLESSAVIMQMDLGLSIKTSLRIEVSEENEHFHRIYWTDGVNPLRTINLKENPEYYSNLVAEDLNVFKASKLTAPVVKNILGGGNVSCGSHSYCYRLVTLDGKSSRVSNITNPINVAKTIPETSYHLTLGGSLSTNSNNSVSLQLNDIDPAYGAIQIIDITYTSAEGAITANIISESQITSTTYNYTHNGNETKTSISLGELLKSHVSWNTCGDLAIKDNRLFASNLTNQSDSIDLDFRVKSFKYADDGTGTATTYTGTENTDIHEDTLYVDGKYGFLDRASNSKIPGAETPNYNNITDGVRVTFATKKFDLSEVKYFHNPNVVVTDNAANKASTTIGEVPHYGFLDKTFDGGFNNYKNPLFTEKFTGYQRGEIYRFGILFYDTNGNPTFVSPIGDIRMPDGIQDYITNDATDGRVVGNAAEGQLTFKHAGSITQKLNVKKNNNTTLQGVSISLDEFLFVGDLVSGVGIHPGTYVTAISGNNATISMTATDDLSGVLFFDKPTQDIHGFAMYPKFQVKLSADTRSKISGYSIVRVDRTEQDKSVLSSGVLNQTIIHENNDGNDSMRHKNGQLYSNIYSPAAEHESMSQSTFTYDTPESTLGSFSYSKKTGDKLKVVARLDAGFQDFTADTVPDFSTIGTESDMQHLRQYETDFKSFLLSGRYAPKSNETPKSIQYSNKVLYTQYYAGINDTRTATQGSAVAIAQGIKPIEYGQNLGPAEEVSSSKQGYDNHSTGRINQSFVNKCRFTEENDVFVHVPDEFSNHKHSNHVDGNAKTLHGVETVYLSLGGRTESESSENAALYEIDIKNFEIGKTPDSTNKNPFVLNFNSDSEVDKQYCFAQKLYAQVRRDVRSSQYGGSLPSNYEANQYISTGHVNFNPQALNNDEVFGGDTFINMYSLKKFCREDGFTVGSDIYPSPAIIFPVESTVNIDLRDGTFFGSTDDISYQAHDAFLMNETYSARNTTKTFLQKPFSFKDVNNYSNIVAASNLKLAGNLFDAFTTWDANEIHELDNTKGPIYNLFNLRNELFAIQSSGVSKLSINPRVVVDNADAAAVTIVTGTGQVIQRSDYISTLYGSQHFNNSIVTDTAAYWFDRNMLAFCKLNFGQGLAVQDLGLTTQNSNIFYALKNSLIGDKPLDYEVGGICLYHNKIFDEVGVCIMPQRTIAPTHMIYSELNDVMVTKKHQAVQLAFNIPGELLTVGRSALLEDAITSNNIYRENINNSFKIYYGQSYSLGMSIQFVCNENVFTSKKFDKLVMYLSGNLNTQRFTNFTFQDSISASTFSNEGTGEKMLLGKHIIPITSKSGSAKARGQYLIINAFTTDESEIELFGALIHNRTTT